MFLNRSLCLETILMGKRNILKRVGDTVVTTSLQQEKRTIDKWKVKDKKLHAQKKKDKETREKWNVESNKSATSKYRDQILWSTSWQIQTRINAFTF